VKRLPLALAAILAAPLFAAGEAADLGAQLRNAELDPAECYRLRDIHLSREDLRFYFTDGWLVFGKPIGGRVVSAVFIVHDDAGEAELLVMPPTAGERMSLANFTQSPTLNERFYAGLFLFTDDSADVLKKAVQARGDVRKSTERGLLIAQTWNATVANLATSFSTRLVQHIHGRVSPERGIFYAGLQGRKLGNFDAFHDPESVDSVYLGQLKYKDDRAFYDTWTSFPSRSRRAGDKRPGPDFGLANYRIEAVMDAALHLKAVTQVALTPKRGGLRVLSFDISARMPVSTVRINGEEAEVFRRDSLRSDLIRGNGSVLFLVIPPEPLEEGRHYEVVFEHEGDVVTPAGGKVYYVGGRGNWYPRHGLEFVQHDITFTYPAGLQLVFPGDLKDDRTEGTERTTRRVTSAPIRMAGFNLGDFESSKTTRGPLTVEVYANRGLEAGLAPRREPVVIPPPNPFPRRGGGLPRGELLTLPPPPAPDPTNRLATLASDIAGAYEFFHSHLGPPALPSMMVSPIPGTFGQGFPGLVYLSTLSYLDPKDRPVSARESAQQVFFSELLQAHETAHQWWGNVVTPATTQEEWLMEALANYASLMYLEKRKGPKAMAAVLDEYKERLLQKDESDKTIDAGGPVRLGSRLQNSLSAGTWRSIVYGKGTWITHMLRRRLGDASFFKMLGEICRKYRYQTITAKDFQTTAAAYLPKGDPDPKLDHFFEHWVESTGIPNITMTTAVKGKAPRVRLTVNVAHNSIDNKALIVVPVHVQLARAKTQVHWITAASEPVTINLDLPAAPLKVTLDPDNSVLRQ
jgi:hypothetical protein